MRNSLRLMQALLAALLVLAASPAGAAETSPAAADGGSQLAPAAEELLAQLEIRDDPDPRAAPAIRDGIAALVQTQSGAELARAFLAEKQTASIGFAAVAGTSVLEFEGARTLAGGSGGYSDPKQTPPRIMLNRNYLEISAPERSAGLASTLAHEMFGHCLEYQRAKAAGFPLEVLRFDRVDEGNASMLGWLVDAELGGRGLPAKDQRDAYLYNPETFYQRLGLLNPYYAVGLSRSEMRDPVAAWRARLEQIEPQRKVLIEARADDVIWRIIAQHFIDAHGIPAHRFDGLRLQYEIETHVPAALAQLDAVEKILRDILAYAAGAQGQRLLAELREASRAAYIDLLEQRMQRYAARLKGELAKPAGPPEKPPSIQTARPIATAAQPPGEPQISLRELEQLWDSDSDEHQRAVRASAP